jgi:hypothetical protein
MRTVPDLPFSPPRRFAGTIVCALALAVCCAATVAAGERVVVVNGELLDAGGLAVVDTINCGVTVPDGVYWIDFDAATWGVVGHEGSEPLPDCNAAVQQAAPAEEPDDCESRYAYWEDRMMYCHGVNPN